MSTILKIILGNSEEKSIDWCSLVEKLDTYCNAPRKDNKIY